MAIRSLLSSLLTLFRRSKFEQDMSVELEEHRRLYADDLIRQGMPHGEAERRANMEFGTVQAIKDDCREAMGLRWFDELQRDLRFAIRVLFKAPGFTATVLVILASVVGVNSAIFSLVDAVLLRGLPYPDPDGLVQVVTAVERRGSRWTQEAQSGATFELLRDGADFLDLAAHSANRMGVNFATGERPRYVSELRVSAGFFGVLGVSPFLGREFHPDEDRPGGEAVTILSHSLFERELGADPSVLGRTVLLRGEPHRIVGVMPQNFQTHVPADLWTPLRPSTQGEGGGTNYSVIARLGPELSAPRARSLLEPLSRETMTRLRIPPETTARLELAPLERLVASSLRGSLLLSLVAVLTVLAIGCVNVAGLMLARANTRTREMATRMVMGGGRARILRQLLTESLLLAGLGGLLGLGIGYSLIEATRPLIRESLGLWQVIELDGRVLAMTMVLAMSTSIAFGLAPALSATRLDFRKALIEGGTRGVAGGRRHWPRRLLLLTQVAMGMVLLMGAGLLLRSLAHLNRLEPGFDATRLMTATLALRDARYQETRDVTRLFEESSRRIRDIPGVESVAVGLSVPYETWLNIPFLNRRRDGDEQGVATMTYVTPGYFETLGVPLLEGRLLEDRDGPEASRVALVSRAFAERYFLNEEPIGHRVTLAPFERESRAIIGVVGDVQQRPNLGGYGPLGAPPAIYIPIGQTSDELLRIAHTWFSPSWIVRAGSPRSSVRAAMSEAMASVDPLLPFSAFRDFDELRRSAVSRQRYQALLLAAMAGVALMLVAAGMWGLIAQSVSERRRELGIRLAVGASRRQAVANAALPGLTLAGGGIALGSLLAGFLLQLLEAFVWGVRPLDPLTFAVMGAGLFAVAAAASLIPALEVLRLDPARTLRVD